MGEILSARELARTYDSNGASVLALRGVDMAVEEGELVAVMGPSGCGKSTLLNLLGGLDRPTAGEVFLDGTRIDNLSEGKRAVIRRHQVGIVFQAYNLIGNLTVADNIELPALVAGLSSKEARARRETLLEELAIADKSNAVPAKLSGGEQQRVAIARALINRPRVLLADEPTGNLDTKSAREVVDLLRRYNADGQTIVLITHDPRVASTANRIMRMRDGWIVDETRIEDRQDTKAVMSSLIDLEV
jgi:putative ABC transport system ATP-binding protein